MKKSIKPSYLIMIIMLILSIVLPFTAFLIKAPSFISEKEMTIIKFKEPSSFELKMRKYFDDLILTDPFKSVEKARSDNSEKSKKLVSPGQISLIYSGKNKFVIIGNIILKEGDKFENFTVRKIFIDRVLLIDIKGEEIWLNVENF